MGCFGFIFQHFKEQLWSQCRTLRVAPGCPALGILLISGEKMEEVLTLFCQYPI
jgi:hypothetical protein